MSTPDLAAARAQIAARRAAQEHERVQHTQTETDTRSALSTLPPSLRAIAHQGIDFYTALRSPTGTRPAFRVGQVDAELLDEELLSLLKTQVGDALKYLGSQITDDWSAEITTALRAVLWKLCIWDRGASYGGSLQGLKYVDARHGPTTNGPRSDPTRWQKAGHGLLTVVVGTYGWQKWESWLLSQTTVTADDHDRRGRPRLDRLARMTRWLGTAHETASLCSFLVFLYNGRYRTLTDRLLRLRLAPAESATDRQVSFEYLNRQLVWHAFTEFLLFVLPLVGVARWKRILARVWKQFKTMVYFRSTPSRDDKVSVAGGGEMAFLSLRTCAICYKDQTTAMGSEREMLAGSSSGVVGSAQTDITNPYETVPCGCVYCFVCLAHAIEASEGHGWSCLRCGTDVVECKPWNGDVLEDIIREEMADTKRFSRKSVVFAQDDYYDDEEMEQDEGPNRRLSQLDPIPIDYEGDQLEKQFYDIPGSDTSDADASEAGSDEVDDASGASDDEMDDENDSVSTEHSQAT